MITIGGALNVGVLLFAAILIAAAALSPGSAIFVPLRLGGIEVVAVVTLTVAALALLPKLWRAIDIALARHYVCGHFFGGPWRARRTAAAFGVACMFISSIIVLGVYLLAALSPSGTAALNVNAFGEALPELELFAVFGVPAAIYSYVNALGVQGGHLATFRRLYARQNTGAGGGGSLPRGQVSNFSFLTNVCSSNSMLMRHKRKKTIKKEELRKHAAHLKVE